VVGGANDVEKIIDFLAAEELKKEQHRNAVRPRPTTINRKTGKNERMKQLARRLTVQEPVDFLALMGGLETNNLPHQLPGFLKISHQPRF